MMIISVIREIVNPKVTQIAKCGSLASTVIDSARRLRVFLGRPIASWFVLIDDRLPDQTDYKHRYRLLTQGIVNK